MKSLLILTVIFAAATANAGTSILCKLKSSPLFYVVIETHESIPRNSGLEIHHNYDAIVTLTGPRLSQTTSEVLQVEYIQTRVDVGLAYHVDLGQGSMIDLVNIWFNPQGETHFNGQLTHQHGHAQPLSCQYKHN